MLPAGDKPKRVHVFPLAKALVLVGKLIPELQDATRFVEADAEGTVKVRCPCMAAYPKRDWFTLRQKCHIAEHARSRQHVECAYPFSPRAVAPRLLLLCWTILAAVFPALRALCSRLCALCVHRPALPPTAATASCCAGLDEDHTIKHRDKRSRANASTVGAGGAGGAALWVCWLRRRPLPSPPSPPPSPPRPRPPPSLCLHKDTCCSQRMAMEVWREAQGGPSQGVAAAHRRRLRCHPSPPPLRSPLRTPQLWRLGCPLTSLAAPNSLTMLDEDTIVCGACECDRGGGCAAL